MSDVITRATEEVTEMKTTVDSLYAKMEDILKAQANIEKALVRSDSEEKEIGKGYGFLQAKAEVAKGKTARVPYWDEKTSEKFSNFLRMHYAKDLTGIKKAFGDNVQDNLSYFIPTEFRSEIVRLAFQSSIALQKCTIVPIGRDVVRLPAPTGNYTVSWVDAGAASTDSKLTAAYVELDSHKAAAIALVNKEDLDDSAFPLAPFIAQSMGEDFGKFIDTEVFQGDDSDTTNHVFDGIEYAANVQAVTGGADASPTFAKLLLEANLLATVGKLNDLQLAGAEWYFTTGAWAAIRAIADGASSKIVRLNEKYLYDLLGFPVNLRAEVGTTATVSRAAGFFGNLKWVYIGDRMDFRIDTSEHYRFANDQVVFRGLQRLATKVALPTALVRIMFGAAS